MYPVGIWALVPSVSAVQIDIDDETRRLNDLTYVSNHTPEPACPISRLPQGSSQKSYLFSPTGVPPRFRSPSPCPDFANKGCTPLPPSPSVPRASRIVAHIAHLPVSPTRSSSPHIVPPHCAVFPVIIAHSSYSLFPRRFLRSYRAFPHIAHFTDRTLCLVPGSPIRLTCCPLN